MKLHEFQKELDKCCYCGFCLEVCPLYQHLRKESHSPRGKVLILKELLREEASWNQGISKRLELCLGCGACYEHCPHQIPLHQMVSIARSRAVERFGLALRWRLLSRVFTGDQRKWEKNLQIFRVLWSIYAYPHLPWPFYRWQGVKRYAPKPARKSFISQHTQAPRPLGDPARKLTLFVGCLTNFFFPATGKNVSQLLTKLGYEIDVPVKQACCGSPLYYIGDRKLVLKHIYENIRALAGSDPIVTLCGACGEMLKIIYPKLFPKEASDFSERVKDVTQILAEHAAQLRPKFPDQGVAYYDSCRLRRGMGVVAEPRELLKEHYPQFISVRKSEDCCGFAGPFSAFNYPLSMKIASNKVSYLKETPIRWVAVGDPGCRIHLVDVARRANLPVKIIHLADLFSDEVISHPLVNLSEAEDTSRDFSHLSF